MMTHSPAITTGLKKPLNAAWFKITPEAQSVGYFPPANEK